MKHSIFRVVSGMALFFLCSVGCSTEETPSGMSGDGPRQKLVIDSGFGTNGMVLTKINRYKDDYCRITDALVHGNGRIVITVQSYDQRAVLGYTPQGVLDSSFGNYTPDTNTAPYSPAGTNGMLPIRFEPRGITALPDGRIIVSGATKAQKYFILVLSEDGVPDASFSRPGSWADGYVIGTYIGYPGGLALLGDGGLVLGGGFGGFLAYRLQPDGTPDPGFGSGGLVEHDIGSEYDEVYRTLVQPDGKIVLAGHASDGMNFFIALLRLLPGGAVDATFGVEGIVKTYCGMGVYDIKLTEEGKILALGYNNNDSVGKNDMTLLQYDGNGSPDPGFAANGKLLPEFYGKKIIAQPEGGFLLGGAYDPAAAAMLFVRYTANGVKDASFGSGGVAAVSIPGMPDGLQECHSASLLRQNDGKLVTVSYFHDQDGNDYALLARFLMVDE